MQRSTQVGVSAARNGEPDATRFARYGLAIPRQVLKALEKRGIYCQSSVSIEHQHLAKRYVLRATEATSSEMERVSLSALGSSHTPRNVSGVGWEGCFCLVNLQGKNMGSETAAHSESASNEGQDVRVDYVGMSGH